MTKGICANVNVLLEIQDLWRSNVETQSAGSVAQSAETLTADPTVMGSNPEKFISIGAFLMFIIVLAVYLFNLSL